MQVETERKTSLTHLNKESERLSTEQLEGRKLQEELRMERKSIDADRERLEAFAEEIQKRSQEVDELCKVFFMFKMFCHDLAIVVRN